MCNQANGGKFGVVYVFMVTTISPKGLVERNCLKEKKSKRY